MSLTACSVCGYETEMTGHASDAVNDTSHLRWLYIALTSKDEAKRTLDLTPETLTHFATVATSISPASLMSITSGRYDGKVKWKSTLLLSIARDIKRKTESPKQPTGDND
jgi:hypothetical protein